MRTMSTLDVILVVLTLIFAALAVAAPRIGVRALPVAVPLLLAGWLGQWLLEGFYWQFLPALLLAVAAAVLAVRQGIRPRTGVIAVSARVVVGIWAVVAVLALAPAPVPELPAPTGPYAVGSQIYRWVDEQRAEPTAPGERRNVVVQAWYPADQRSGRRYVYIDGYDRLPGSVSGIPGALMRGYGRIDTHATTDVPVSGARERWPVVLFSPGYGAPRAFYTGLVADLASRGFVVLAVDHPFESAVTELADGRLATTVATGTDDDLTDEQRTRAADLRYVLDQLTGPDLLGPLADRIDTGHIAAVGHSFGGAAALAVLAEDPRVAAAANIDGTLYGDLPGRTLTRPVLLVESDRAETGHSDRYLDGNGALLARLAAPGHRYTVTGANHFGFTDVPFFLVPPAQAVLGRFVGGPRDPADTHRTTVALLDAFLREPLGDPAVDIAATAAGLDGVTGGRVR
ncbi:hypothetical protein IU434_16675 [Nocardia farcinica]|nr:hypothetical protein [Nocardia farcinica]